MLRLSQKDFDALCSRTEIKPKRKRVQHEAREQAALIEWAHVKQVKLHNGQNVPLSKLLVHSPNGGSRNLREAKRLKRMGVQAGVSDLFLAYPVFPYAGLFIEFKWGKGKLTKPQVEWLELMTMLCYKTAVVYKWEDAKKVIEGYLRLEN